MFTSQAVAKNQTPDDQIELNIQQCIYQQLTAYINQFKRIPTILANTDFTTL